MKKFEEKVFDDEFDDEEFDEEIEDIEDESYEEDSPYDEEFIKNYKYWSKIPKELFPKTLEELEEKSLIEYLIEVLENHKVMEYRFYRKVRHQEKGLKTLSIRLRRMYIEIGKLMELEKKKILNLKKEFIINNKPEK